MAKKKITLQDIFMNNKFVLVFSIFVAIVIWGTVSMTVSPEETRIIENVKVTLEQSEDSEYQVFGFEDTYVDVTVKGRKYLISSNALSADDIAVVAKSNYVDFAGMQTLTLSATILNNTEVTITNLSQKTVSAYYGVGKTSIVPVEVELNSDNVVPKGYISEDPISSLSTVTIYGPSTEVDKIQKILAKVEIDEEITETTVFDAEVVAVTENGKKAKYTVIEDNMENFTVTVPVSKVEEKKIAVKCVNMPTYYNDNMPEISISPSKIKVAAAQSVLDEIDELIIGTIDFNTIKNTNNKFTFSLSDIDEVKVIDDVSEVTVAVNCYPMEMRNFTVGKDNITLLNLKEGYKAELISNEISEVSIVGKPKNISSFDDVTQLYAKVDLASADVGTKSYDADVYIKNDDTCWVYGKYTVKVKVTRN